MGDMAGFAEVGSPVLMRPSGVVRAGNCIINADGAHIGGSQGRPVTLYEQVFAGMPTGSLAGATHSLGGLSWIGFANGSGGAAEIVSAGLKVTSPINLSAEAGLYTSTGEIRKVVGDDRWRRGGIGIWCRVVGYAFPAACFWYAPLVDFDYPDAGFMNRRNRSADNANNDATGGWVIGVWYAGTYAGGPQRNGAGASEEVSLLYFRNPWTCDHYRGSWSPETGWPKMEDMIFGGMTRAFMGVMTRYDATVARLKLNTLASARVALSGGAANFAGVTITFERMRITAWD
jgi:hypothetical protein